MQIVSLRIGPKRLNETHADLYSNLEGNGKRVETVAMVSGRAVILPSLRDNCAAFHTRDRSDRSYHMGSHDVAPASL